MFYARLEALCRESGTSVAAVAEDVLHVSSGTPTGWKKGVSPKAEIVAIAARHFGVSADYLLGLTTDRRSLETARALDGDEARLVDALRRAPEPVRQAVLRMAASALEAHGLTPAKPATEPTAQSTAEPAAQPAAEPAARPPLRAIPPARGGLAKFRRTGRAWKGVEGVAAAGEPITAVPEDERRILVPVKYTGEQYFIVQAEGDSMIGTVEDGDYCVFNKRGLFDDGHIVLVQVDGPTDQPDATIKRIHRRPGNRVELRSENPKYPPMIYRADEVLVMGELVARLPQSGNA